jgi:gamma-glutamyltranspeptidase
MILGWLMFRSGLVGRRIALVGVVGGAMLATSGAAVLLGVIPQGSSLQGILTIPEIVWELFLGLYLTFKGFKRTAWVIAESTEATSSTTPMRSVGAAATGGAA